MESVLPTQKEVAIIQEMNRFVEDVSKLLAQAHRDEYKRFMGPHLAFYISLNLDQLKTLHAILERLTKRNMYLTCKQLKKAFRGITYVPWRVAVKNGYWVDSETQNHYDTYIRKAPTGLRFMNYWFVQGEQKYHIRHFTGVNFLSREESTKALWQNIQKQEVGCLELCTMIRESIGCTYIPTKEQAKSTLERREKVCSQCDKKRTAEMHFYKCSNCKFVYYCSRECQEKQWKSHKIVCDYFKSIALLFAHEILSI
jgi:hypothetical protein